MFNADIKVSVMMTTFNHENYISQAIESVLAQKVDFQFELIVGDDASTDRTSEIIKQYVQKYPNIIKHIRQEKNLGPTRNGYECLLHARGKYIACCEGDDYWCDANKLQKQVDFLDSFPQYSAVTHEILVVDELGQRLKRQKLSWISKKRRFGIKDFKGIFMPGHINSMVRRNYFLDPNYDGTILYKAHSFVGDRTVTLTWASKGMIYRMPEIMSCYRFRTADNMTSKLYSENINGIKTDFAYTKALEKYAKEILKKEVNFDYHKSELIVSAFVRQIKTGTFGESQELMSDIIKSCKNKPYCFMIFPYIFFRKIIIKMFYVN